MLMMRDKLTELLIRNMQALMALREVNAHELAARAGMNPTAVYDIVSGKARSPKIETVAKLAEALGVAPATLFEEPSEANLRAELQQVYARLSTEERYRLVAIAQALLGSQRVEPHDL
jgi:transcriptional regulator with XRE-family HTH domain